MNFGGDKLEAQALDFGAQLFREAHTPSGL
jgi:hypothetical protein